MHYRIMLSFYGLIFAIAAFAMQAHAVSLGKIDIASHLGEPFYAEVPLTLEDDEVISSVFVELAAPADYRILEVYRDQALNAVRADVESDSRGSRVELSSRTVIDAPFFNLVLKVRYGRATHYKKYPVFLDLPRAARPVKKAAPLPTVSIEDIKEEPAVAVVSPVRTLQGGEAQAEEESADAQPSAFKPFDGWARTSHYGPMVYGDTISTVADRLRVDNRYTRNQVMVALFEKNRSKFEQDNINLIQAGTHLDVPTAAEVERIRPDQARSIMQEHNRRWQELVKQPRYAAVAEAQRTRYSKRVRMGKSAAGVAAAPVSERKPADETVAEHAAEPAPVSEGAGVVDGVAAGQATAESAALAEALSKLQKENEELQAKLAESDAKLAKISAAEPSEAQVAAEARIKRLELQLARLQAELDSARQSRAEAAEPDWLMLVGSGLVLLLLGGGAGYLMRRERQHPAMEQVEEASVAVPSEPEAPEEIEVEAVEEFVPDTTKQIHTDEFEDAFTDSIPDLTDEETGEIEAFKEDVEDEPDPNVDYLSEADVYMRYGMEDEAEKQVRLALKLRENNKDAHVKLVQVRKAKGDEAGVDEAISTARMVLSGDALSSFESSIADLTASGSSNADEVSLEDTLPPGGLDVSADLQAEVSLEETPELSGPDEIEFESEGETALKAVPENDQPEEEVETLELGDIEWPAEIGEETVADEQEAAAEEAGSEETGEEGKPVDVGGLDFDLSGLELSESDEAAAEDESGVAVQMDDDGLDLSDLDMSGEAGFESPGEAAADQSDELMTADLDKTVVMDWSRETVTSGDYDAGGESGAGEEKPASEVSSDAVLEEDEPEEHLSSIEFDLDDLDVDLEVPVSSDDLDDFSSTIQTSIEEIKKESDAEAKEKADTINLNEGEAAEPDEESADALFGLEPLDEEAVVQTDEKTIGAAGMEEAFRDFAADDASLEELNEKSEDKDFDATLELDNLLSELGDLDEDKSSPDDNNNRGDKGDL